MLPLIRGHYSCRSELNEFAGKRRSSKQRLTGAVKCCLGHGGLERQRVLPRWVWTVADVTKIEGPRSVEGNASLEQGGGDLVSAARTGRPAVVIVVGRPHLTWGREGKGRRRR